MKALKAYFLSRLLREKALLLGFLLLIALWWFSHVVRRVVVFGRDFRNTTMVLHAQSASLARQAEVAGKVKRALSQLEPSRTLDSAHLQGDLTTLAAGLSNTEIDARPSDFNDQFNIHTVQFSVRKADWATLQSFYVELSKRAPYINIEQCSISADKANPAQLNATMQISSVEIKR